MRSPEALLVAVKGTVSSTAAHLTAKSAGPRAAYESQYSTDQSTCTTPPGTLQANVDLSRLTVSTSSSFRVRVSLKGGLGDPGQVLSLIVADVVPSGDGLRVTVAAM